MKQWLDKDGERFLTKIGIGKGQTVVDFGCGEGNISVPAAKAVGSGGKIYSLDKDSGVLRSLARKAEKFKLKNIETIEMKNLQIPLPDGVADAVLLYDVLHYLNSADRKKVYVESFRILKESGFLSVYPKHNKNDFPLWNLAALDENAISDEIEKVGFRKIGRFLGNVLHDGYLNKGIVLNFAKN